MTNIVKIVLILVGFDPRRFINTLLYFPRFLIEYFRFKKSANLLHLQKWKFRFNPRLNEYKSKSAKPTKHYFVQDNLVADLIAKKTPATLLDIGSRVDGYITQVRHVTKVIVADLREPNYVLNNVEHVICDITDPVSVSHLFDRKRFPVITCLHTIEHIGLGRYGDAIDILGDAKALKNIFCNMLENSEMVLSVPFSDAPRIEFNAHRVYDLKCLREILPLEAREIRHWFINDEDEIVNSFEDRGHINFGVVIMLLQKKKT